jgi:hypothetical protein
MLGKSQNAKVMNGGSLTDLLKSQHVSEEESLRKTNKAAIEQKSGARMAASKTKHNLVWSMMKMTKVFRKGIEGETSFSEKSIFGKIFYILIGAPFELLRRITIPPPDGEAWDRRLAAIVPFFAVFFVYATTGFIDFTEVPHFSFWILQGVALLCSILI